MPIRGAGGGGPHRYPGHTFTGLDEYIGYQHANLRTTTSRENVLQLQVNYDPHYCRAVIAKGSTGSCISLTGCGKA